MKKRSVPWILKLSAALFFFNGVSAVAHGLEPASRRTNPFTLPEGVVLRALLPKEKEPEKKEEIKLRLRAITTVDHKKIASINNRNFEVGDEVIGKKVIEIGSDRVVLEDENGRMTLTLERPAFEVKVSQE